MLKWQSVAFREKLQAETAMPTKLPMAEYVIHMDEGLEDVRTLAARTAQSTERKFRVIVAEYSRSAWVGLASA